MQNLARFVYATLNNDNRLPPAFEDVMGNYNAIIEQMTLKKTDLKSLETAVRDMSDLYNKISTSLNDISPIYRITGRIGEMSPTSKIVMNSGGERGKKD
jgi:chaperonin cofactor prefoldin